MNKLLLMATGVSVSMLGMAPAWAGHRDRYDDGYYAQQPAYGYASQRASARVIDAQPIYRSVRVSEPRQECWDERVSYRDARYDNNVAVGGLIGAVAGGVLGHQFGGHGAGTAVGAVVGASVGANAAAANTPRGYYSGYEQRCRTVQDTHVEQQVEAYDVSYQYQGRVYHTQLPYDPGDRIEVDVDVRPVAY